MMKKLILCFIVLLSLFSSCESFASSGIGLSRGFSGIDGMNGYGLTWQSYWGNIANISNNLELTGLWNFSLAYWSTSRSKNTHYSNITIFSLLPTLRLQRKFAYNNGIAPFFDLGYGLGILNRDQFSNQQLGGYGTFVFSVGFGINFGAQSQYDLAYHYRIYNNAGQFKNDDGLYANQIGFVYHFA